MTKPKVVCVGVLFCFFTISYVCVRACVCMRACACVEGEARLRRYFRNTPHFPPGKLKKKNTNKFNDLRLVSLMIQLKLSWLKRFLIKKFAIHRFNIQISYLYYAENRLQQCRH